MKTQILHNWNLMRWVRLIVGTAITVQSFYSHEVAMTAIGVVYAGMAVFNTACCGSGGCAVSRNDRSSDTKDI